MSKDDLLFFIVAFSGNILMLTAVVKFISTVLFYNILFFRKEHCFNVPCQIYTDTHADSFIF